MDGTRQLKYGNRLDRILFSWDDSKNIFMWDSLTHFVFIWRQGFHGNVLGLADA